MSEFGQVVAYNHKHRAGVIRPEDGTHDIAVLPVDIDESGLADLMRHCRVVFERVEDERGQHAAKIIELLPLISKEERERTSYHHSLEQSLKTPY